MPDEWHADLDGGLDRRGRIAHGDIFSCLHHMHLQKDERVAASARRKSISSASCGAPTHKIDHLSDKKGLTSAQNCGPLERWGRG
jgi:hypothetical protein